LQDGCTRRPCVNSNRATSTLGAEIAAIHCVAVPGPEKEVVPRYADQIAADFVLLGKEHLSRPWFKKNFVALRCQRRRRVALDGPRVACIDRRPGHPVYRAATSIICRCGGLLADVACAVCTIPTGGTAMLEDINLMAALDGGEVCCAAEARCGTCWRESKRGTRNPRALRP
jgi:hypothetical protein